MAEFNSVAAQTVDENQNVLFTNTTSPCNRGYVVHREGSGLFTVRSCTNNCRAKYRVSFSGNIAVADGGTAEAISVAIALNGEADLTTQGVVTPAATGDYFNVAVGTDVWVPRGCCTQVSIKNISTQAIDVANANITFERLG